MAQRWEYIRICTPGLNNEGLAQVMAATFYRYYDEASLEHNASSPIRGVSAAPLLVIKHGYDVFAALYPAVFDPTPTYNPEHFADLTIQRGGLSTKQYLLTAALNASQCIVSSVAKMKGFFANPEEAVDPTDQSVYRTHYDSWRVYIRATLAERIDLPPIMYPEEGFVL
jgi:hypothetical protein